MCPVVFFWEELRYDLCNLIMGSRYFSDSHVIRNTWWADSPLGRTLLGLPYYIVGPIQIHVPLSEIMSHMGGL